MVTVEAVNDTLATNADPPTVRLRIDEVLRGSLPPGLVQAVWSDHLHLLCPVGEHATIKAWSERRVEGPRVGERWIVSGGMSRDRVWFEAVPYHRVRFTPTARAEALRQLGVERAQDPGGPARRRRQQAEDRAAVREYELIAAVKAHDGARVRGLLRSGVRAAAADNDGRSALVWAVETGALDTARLLLAAGARADGAYAEPARYADGFQATPLDAALLRAAEKGSCEAVELLLKAGARAWARGRGGTTALIYAALAGSSQCVRTLIAGGADPNGSDDFGITALMRAAYAGRSEMVEILLEHGAQAAGRHYTGRTAADFAALGSEAPALSRERRAEYAVLVERLRPTSRP